MLHAAEDTAAPLNALREALATATASIAQYAAESSSECPHNAVGAAPGSPEADALLRELLVALDSDTPDHAFSLLTALAPVFPAETGEALRHCLDNFDFRAAEVLVHQLAAQLGMALEG